MSQCAVAVAVFMCLAVSSKNYDIISFPEINFSTSTALQVTYSLFRDSFFCSVKLNLSKNVNFIPPSSLGPALVCDICVNDNIQQPHSEIPGCGILQCWPLPNHCLQRGGLVAHTIINPRRACAARVTVLVLSVSQCVCSRLFSHCRQRSGIRAIPTAPAQQAIEN